MQANTLTNTGSKNSYKLCPCAANLQYSDLSPYNEKNGNTVSKVFLRKLVEMFLDHIKRTFDRNERILEFHQPEEYESMMDLQLGPKGLPLQQLLNDCHQTLQFHVKNGHPRNFSQLSNGLDLVSLAGEWLSSVCNVNMITYETSTVFSLMEMAVLKHMRKDMIGWNTGESLLTGGVEMANFCAMVVAMHKKYPNWREKGMVGGVATQLVVFTSKASHYSIKKSCMLIGIGFGNCIEIDVGPDDRMKTDDLQKKIDEAKSAKKVPFLVNVAFGTSAFGAFDDLKAILEIAHKANVWVHVDASWGGGLLISKRMKKTAILASIEQADSVSLDPQKLLNAHLLCSSIHFKEEGALQTCFAFKSKSLFMDDKVYDTKYDLGDKTIFSERRNDIFKLWLLWRSRGDEGFEKNIDQCLSLTKYFYRKMQDDSDKYYLIHEPSMVNCCFWYVPKRLREAPHTKEKEEELGKITIQLKNKLMNSGTILVSYMKDDNRAYYLRVTISSGALTEKDIDFLLTEFDRIGQDL